MAYKWKPSATQRREFAQRMKDPDERATYEARKVERADKRRAGSQYDYEKAGGYFVPTKAQHDFCFQNLHLFGTPKERDAAEIVMSAWSCAEKVHRDYLHIVNEKIRSSSVSLLVNPVLKVKDNSINLYATLIKNMINHIPDLKPVNYFTKKMFNDLGGENSAIFKHTKSIVLYNLTDTDKVYIHFELDNQASHEYSAFCIRFYNNSCEEYHIAQRSHDTNLCWEQYVSSDKQLEQNLKNSLRLKEFAFEEREVQATLLSGKIKSSELSAVDINNLKKGKETKALNVLDDKGERIEATLSLKRNGDNSVSLIVNPIQTSEKIKFSQKI